MMKEAIQRVPAIETEWGGWKFRSRLEARWAIFMDRAGVQFEYEPEGFETEAGRYLTDFYLPEHRTWLEIKPRIELVTEYERKRIIALGSATAASTDEMMLVLVGEPWVGKYAIYRVTDGELKFSASPWIQCPSCGRIGPNNIDYVSESGERCKTKDEYRAANLIVTLCVPCILGSPPLTWTAPTDLIHFERGFSFVPKSFDLESCEVRLAFAAARRARFEHGETPR